MMIQLGTSLGNPRPGAPTGQIITGAINDAMRYKGRFAELAEQQAQQKRKEGREDRRIDLEDKRFGLSERELEDRQTGRKSTEEMARERLGLDRERLGIERMKARRAGAGATSTSAKERMAQQLMSSNPGMTLPEALKILAQSENYSDPREYTGKLVQEMVKAERKAQSEWDTNAGLGVVEGSAPNQKSFEEIVQEAQQITDALYGGTGPGTPKPGDAAAAPAGAAPAPLPQITTAEEYAKLKPGQKYKDPNGNVRTKGP